MKNNFYFLYYFFDNIVIRWIRVFAFFLIGFLVYINLKNDDFVIGLLPIFFLLIVQELFIHFKLEKQFPARKISDQYRHIIECVDFRTRSYLERHAKSKTILKHLLNEHEIKYFNKLLDLKFELSDLEISEIDALNKAKELVERVDGSYINAIDLYSSYLLLINESNQFLINNKISEEDIVTLLSWVRKKTRIDLKKHHAIRFSGSGVFDFFVYGWSAELASYAVNYTREVQKSNVTEALGRASEYDLLVTALSKDSSSNAILVGPAGVGKSTLVKQFALDSDSALLPDIVSNKIVFMLSVDRFVSGIENEGDLEERFVYLFQELIHAGNVVVYIPDIENIFGGGGFNIDISGALIDYLRSSNIKIIASTTPEAFQKFIYPKKEVKELFDLIEIEEPDLKNAVFMMLEKSIELQSKYRITILYSAVKAFCELSDSYVNDGTAMPGRAVKLMEDVLSHAKIHGSRTLSKKDVEDFIQQKTNIVMSEPTIEESNNLLHLEEKIHKKVVAQDEAIVAIADAMRRVRSGLADKSKPIASFLFLGPTGVGKTETAKALAECYFGEEKEMIRLDMSEYQNPDAIERILGKSNESQYEDSLSEKILRDPFSLVLLDEFEKAYPPLLDLFLQVLDEGRLTDNLGRTVSFKNAIIIATSNAGSEFIREKINQSIVGDDLKDQTLEKVMQMLIFKPELVNRFDDVVIFKPLSEEEVSNVAKLFLEDVVNQALKKQIMLTFSEDVPRFIVKNAYSMEFGARNLRRFIEQSIESKLSKMILSRELPSGSHAQIIIENSSIVITH